MRAIKNKRLAVVTAAAIVLVATIAGYSYWTAGGTGEGTAGTGTTQDLVVNQTSTVTDMGPGVVAQALSGDFDNDGDGPVYVGAVTAAITGVDNAGCTAADYTINDAGMLVEDEVPAGTAVGAWSGASIEFVNDPARNQDACQGASVTITYTTAETLAP